MGGEAHGTQGHSVSSKKECSVKHASKWMNLENVIQAEEARDERLYSRAQSRPTSLWVTNTD